MIRSTLAVARYAVAFTLGAAVASAPGPAPEPPTIADVAGTFEHEADLHVACGDEWVETRIPCAQAPKEDYVEFGEDTHGRLGVTVSEGDTGEEFAVLLDEDGQDRLMAILVLRHALRNGLVVA